MILILVLIWVFMGISGAIMWYLEATYKKIHLIKGEWVRLFLVFMVIGLVGLILSLYPVERFLRTDK